MERCVKRKVGHGILESYRIESSAISSRARTGSHASPVQPPVSVESERRRLEGAERELRVALTVLRGLLHAELDGPVARGRHLGAVELRVREVGEEG